MNSRFGSMTLIVFSTVSAAFTVHACALTSKAEMANVRYFSPETANLKSISEGSAVESTVSNPKGPLVLRLGRVSSGSNLRERIAYRTATYEVGYYEELRWTERPETYVRRELARSLFEKHGFRRIMTDAAPTLDVEVIAFDDMHSTAGRAARVQLSVTLLGDEKVIFENTLTVDRSVVSGNAPIEDMIAAMANALEAAVDLTAQLVEKALAQQRLVAQAATVQ
jgi:cholesterol transport system auxiliary component